MKIFSFRFGISFEVESESNGFQFETQSLDQIRETLMENGPWFPKQVFFTRASNTADFGNQIFTLHTHEELQQYPAEVVVLFKTVAGRDQFLEAYLNRFKWQEAAGGLVLNPQNELLLIERHGLWDLPKGKIEKGESKEEGAWREVAEECGLKFHTLKEPLETTYHIFLRREKWRFKPTYWYWMQTSDVETLTPQAEEAITSAVWVSLKDIRENMPETYPTIEAVIRDLIYKSVG